MRRKARGAVKKITVKETFRCGRCDVVFHSMISLKRHSKVHLADMQEIKLLEKGHIPIETKFGAGFRGKNKVIIS